MSKQKFHKGDLVRVCAKFPPEMSHFSGAGELAHVVGSYKDQYGTDNVDSYTLLFSKHGEVSWYHTDQLTLIRHDGHKEMKAVEQARKDEAKKVADLNYIIANWKDLRKHTPGATIQALAALIGWDSGDLWGLHGEGLSYYTNAVTVFSYFDPILMSKGVTKAALVKQGKEFKEVAVDYKVG